MRKRTLWTFLVLPWVLGWSSLCFGAMESENYHLTRVVQGAGRASTASESFIADTTLGQASTIGLSSSSGYAIQAGFWFFRLIKGDLNGDGEVDLADLVLSLQVLTGVRPAGLPGGADVDQDGYLTLVEAIYILGTAAGLRD